MDEIRFKSAVIKVVSKKDRILEGIASSRSKDVMGDIVEPDALMESWEKYYSKFPTIRYMHGPEPIGKIIDVRKDNDKVIIRFKISKTEDDIWTKINEGILKGLSIGFFPQDYEEIYDENGKFTGFHFTKVMWIETSVVDTPANMDAVILDKSMADKIVKEGLDAVLKKGVVPNNPSGYGLEDPNKPWNAPTLSDFTDKKFDELSDSEKMKIAKHFAWAAKMPPETFGDLKLPHHDPKTGNVNKHAVDNAMARLDQANIDNKDAVRRHLENHQKEFGEKVVNMETEEKMVEDVEESTEEVQEEEQVEEKTVEETVEDQEMPDSVDEEEEMEEEQMAEEEEMEQKIGQMFNEMYQMIKSMHDNLSEKVAELEKAKEELEQKVKDLELEATIQKEVEQRLADMGIVKATKTVDVEEQKNTASVMAWLKKYAH